MELRFNIHCIQIQKAKREKNAIICKFEEISLKKFSEGSPDHCENENFETFHKSGKYELYK